MEVEPSTSAVSLLSRNICVVCKSTSAQFHFGVITCGACAAFFRRYVNSDKVEHDCTCSRKNARRACRCCRMKQCLAAGMKISMVKSPLENQKSADGDDSNSDDGELPSIEEPIISKSFDRVEMAKLNYDLFNTQREMVKPSGFNIYEVSCILNRDFKKMKVSYQNVFSEFGNFSETEKEVLFANFLPKSNLFESALVCLLTSDQWHPYNIPTLDRWYHRSNERHNLSEDDIHRLFLPFWTFFGNHFKKKILDAKLNQIEISSVLTLLLLGSTSTNIVESTSETCYNLRKVVLRELLAYYRVQRIDETRIAEIMDVLFLIEKADIKFHEEYHLCKFYDIILDPEYSRILSISKL